MPLHLLNRVAFIRRGRSDAGQDLLEYALLVSLIVVTAIGAVEVLGNVIKTSFWDIIAATDF
jgi:Flp pilus assembly pilin Flp